MADSDPPGSGASSAAPSFASFEQALASLEALVSRLESGELPLEAALAAFEEGIALTRTCSAQLDQAEQRIDELVRTPNGLALRPLAVEGGE
jgi:exodeoxyribonuclease VII small subunit